MVKNKPLLVIYYSIIMSLFIIIPAVSAHLLSIPEGFLGFRDSVVGVSINFFQLGIEHVILGIDHVSFLIATIITIQGIKNVLKISVVFTIAHAITLFFFSQHPMPLIQVVAEYFIIFSIIIMAFLSLYGKERYKSFVVFFLGLFHGIGFATAITSYDITKHPIAAIGSFNIGIETGQLVIIGITMLFFFFIQKNYQTTSLKRKTLYFIITFGVLLLVKMVIT